MQSWIKEKYKEHCKPKPVVYFTLIDSEKEKVPEHEENPLDIHIYFVT